MGVSYAAMAYAVLYAILHSSTKYLYLFQKSGGNAGKISTDTVITFECLMLYQKHHLGPVCGWHFSTSNDLLFKLVLLRSLFKV